jgi:tRNA pseudouridine55 synthase
MEGAVYLLDKERGPTSRRAASAVARALGYGKFGHGGTLDPDATGVLLVLLGRATKLSRFLTGHGKRYRFDVVLGSATDTDDATGTVVDTDPAPPEPNPDSIRGILERFTGSFAQRPPAFSAVKVDGERAFRAARRGESPELPSKAVEASGWVVEAVEDRRLRLAVTVSSGTYVRGLARDIGRALGTAAHADAIRRVSVGAFTVDECSPEPDRPESLLTMAGAMRGYPSVRLSGRNLVSVRHGMTVPAGADGTVALLGPGDRLMAVGLGDGTAVRPVCVLRPL